jgi:hypothetical protein
MSVEPDQDAPRNAPEPGFSDAVTYSFADPAADLYGVARLGLAEGAASGLALVFRGGEPVAVRADAAESGGAEEWDAVSVAGLRTETIAPLEGWRLHFGGDVEVDLTFEALAPALELDPESETAKAGGMAGFDHLCRVHGQVDGGSFEGLGQRGRSWGTPDWEKMALARTLSAWMDGHAVSAVAVRPAKAKSHADERVAAFVFDADREEDPLRSVAAPRISTAYDDEGRQRRAGLELYVAEDDQYPRRAAGEAIAGTSLDLGRLRLDCAFFRWHMEGRVGIGRYDVVRHHPASGRKGPASGGHVAASGTL